MRWKRQSRERSAADGMPIEATGRQGRPRRAPKPGRATVSLARSPCHTWSQQNDKAPEVPVQSQPTNEYGVGLSRTRFTSAAYFSGKPIDYHTIWLQYSDPIPVVTQVTGHRVEHEPGPGSLCICPAGADAVCESSGPSEGMLIRVSAECFALAKSELAPYGSVLAEQLSGRDDTLFRIGRTLEAEAAAGHPNGMLFWSSAADALIRRLTVHHMSTSAAPRPGALSAEALERLDAYIRANLAEPLDLVRLAAVVGCDRFHFAHRFRATVGTSPHRYVMRLRLKLACERIRAGTGALAEIALATGFADQSHLCRWVRQVYNLRPTDLRR